MRFWLVIASNAYQKEILSIDGWSIFSFHSFQVTIFSFSLNSILTQHNENIITWLF